MPEQKEQKQEQKQTEEEKAQGNSEQKPEQSLKEQRVRAIAQAYYSRADVRKAMLDFSKNRECVPRYFEGFGKRPDSFQFESDIMEFARRGATSFHSSEEIWKDPIELLTGMREAELNALRIGWDLLIDLDCKYPEYSKKAASSIIQALKSCGVDNIGLKFSGSKGFHILVPWKAFPQELSGKKTCEMFPEWPRRICAYLKEKSRVFLEKEMSTEDSTSLAKFKRGVRCETCKNLSEEGSQILYVCSSCKTKLENMSDVFKRKRIIRCPNCSKEMLELSRSKFFVCNRCNKNSKNYPDNFNEQAIVEDIFEVLGLDVILVSSRHLFRMPYSLHEKTALASVVLEHSQLKDFDMIRDANPLKVQVKNFIPDSKPNEAQRLLMESLEYKIPEEKFNLANVNKNNQENKQEGDKKYKEVTIKDFSSKIYPPSINKILAGMEDGRKRGLFILLGFFKSLKMPDDRLQKEIESWNLKNLEPLPPGYIKGQLMWHAKAQTKLPPNFDKPYYKEIGIIPTQEELKSKNPVSYAVKKSFALRGYNSDSSSYRKDSLKK
jgi:DNA-directed RNA polymerase subunit RPC12/RpoP